MQCFVLVLLLICGCGPRSERGEIPWQQFSGALAYGHVEKLVGFGARPSGSAALGRSAAYIKEQLLKEQLQSDGLTVEEQIFTAPTPYGPKQFRNLIAKTRLQHGDPHRIIVIGSHYDTKFMTNITFVGANDGGSSTGVLLELAHRTAQQPDLWFVFFDGEEAMVEYGDRDGLWGSKFFVEELKRTGQAERVKAMVLLDMVGDADLHVMIPANSTGWLAQNVFDAARATGFRDFFGFHRAEILDDHIPFLRAGIPAIDLIDFEFGSAPGLNDYWHTDKDTLDKISPRSMEIIGQTTLRLIALLQNKAAGQ